MKKFIAILLALLMMTASFGAVAEGAQEDYAQAALDAGRRVTTTVTLTDVATDISGDPAVDKVVYDLLSAVTITAYNQGEETGFAIGMKQTSGAVADLLTLAYSLQGDDAYIMTNIIGGTIVVGKDEVVPVLQRLIDVFAQMGFIPEDEAEQIKAELPEMMELVMQELTASLAAEAALANIDFTQLNYDAVMGLVTTIAGKLTESEVGVLPRNCDAAVTMYTLTMTPDDMKGILDAGIQFIKDNPDLADAIAAYIQFDATIAPELGGVVEGDVDFMSFLDTLKAEMAEEELFAGDMVCRYWIGEDGSIVAMDAVAPYYVDGETVNMTMNYGRLTLNDMVAHSIVVALPGGDVTLNVVVKGESVRANLSVAEDGETMIYAFIDYADRSQENLNAADAQLEITLNGVEIDDGFGNVSDNETLVMTFDMAFETAFDGVDFEEKNAITFTLNGKTYGTLNIVTKTSPAAASITEGDVVRPAALSDSEFVNWFIGAYSNLYSWLSNALYALPSSFMNLLNTGF